ncbi:hypothetical protein [Catenulispora rubra]|uniref:hypothetical protein n=1 Tax=Catenulispora rubra TaxID=280293 RepID=UPI001891F4E6|nr:hypothetical protein [Catenulispora rubra]
MPTCLLDYAFSTAPTPLQVNGPNSQATSRINLSVSAPTTGIFCSEITVAVPVGVTASDFCLEAPSTSVNTGKWTIASQDVVKGEEIGLPPGEYASITFQCRDQADYGLGYSLVLSLVGVVNSVTGTFVYAVREMSGTSPDDLTPKTGQHGISKQDAIFTLTNFVATAADKPTVPGTIYGNGQAVRLSWESTGTWFQLYAKGGSSPLYAGAATSFTVDGGLSVDTQFVLVASVTGNPSQDSPSPGYQTIYLYDALTLAVSNPDLTPRTVTATGAVTAASATVKGRTTALGGMDVGIDAAPTDVRLHGKMQVTESVSTAGLAVTGPANLTQNLQVTGSATIGQGLQVTGMTTLGDASASVLNAASVTGGGITANGPGNSLVVQGGGQLWIDTGNRNAAQIFNTSNQYPCGWFQNRAGRTGNYVTGVVGWVAQTSDTGLYTNGRMALSSGTAALTHLPTRHGHRVVTSPLVTEAELHISGSGHLTDGRARVEFDEDVADLVLYTHHTPYRVLVTPTGRCAGLLVVEKTAGFFIVEEAGEGHSDAPFDWIVITRQRADGENTIAMELPSALPIPEEPPGDGVVA